MHINGKIHDPEEGEPAYPAQEMAQDLARMLLAAKSLIQMNVNLSERVLKAEKFAEDTAVKLLSKELDIYELRIEHAHCRKET